VSFVKDTLETQYRVKEQKEDLETNALITLDLKSWVNAPSENDEGFYPLHYASFHGNHALIKLLVDNGADIMAKNKQGINMMHVGA